MEIVCSQNFNGNYVSVVRNLTLKIWLNMGMKVELYINVDLGGTWVVLGSKYIA